MKENEKRKRKKRRKRMGIRIAGILKNEDTGRNSVEFIRQVETEKRTRSERLDRKQKLL
jgi:hypothetical protein